MHAPAQPSSCLLRPKIILIILIGRNSRMSPASVSARPPDKLRAVYTPFFSAQFGDVCVIVVRKRKHPTNQLQTFGQFYTLYKVSTNSC